MIFNLFRKNKIDEDNNEIILSIKKDKTISIVLNINPESDNIGKTVAELLYSIHIGNLEESLISLIVDLQNKPEYAKISEDIIYYWLQLKKDNNLPYISPLKAFHNEK